MQNLSVRISALGSCRTTSARPLYEDLLGKISLSKYWFTSGSCRTSCAKSLNMDRLSKISLAGSLHQDPVGPFVQDHFARISVSGFCMPTCARFLFAALLCKIFLSGSLYQNPGGPCVQDLCMWLACARSLCQDLCIRIL